MSTDQKIRQTIYDTAKRITREVAVDLNKEFEPDALDMIGELTYRKLLSYGLDLDVFQKHGKRSTITADDVKLLVRRNDALKRMLDSKLKTLVSVKPPEPILKRKRKGTDSSS